MRYARRPTYLLLTATVDPRGAMSTARADPLLREADYISGLRSWSDAGVPIIFCENSGWDLDRIAREIPNPDRVRFLSFVAPDYPPTKGKSFGEALILQHVIDQLRDTSPETRIIKATGRLRVPNSAKVLRAIAASNADVVCAMSSRALDYSECRLFAASIGFLTDYFLPLVDAMDETAQPMMNFERVLGRAVLRAVADGRQWSPLEPTPIFLGRAGTTNERYLNLRYPAKELFRAIRRVAARYDL